MMVWPFLMAFSAVVACIALYAREGAATAIAIFVAYVAARWVKTAIEPDLQVVAFALLWMAVGGFDALKRGPDSTTALLAGVSLCYLWAKITQAPWVFGSAPFVTADILAVLAMGSIAWGALDAIRHSAHDTGVFDLGRGSGRGASNSVGRVASEKTRGE